MNLLWLNFVILAFRSLPLIVRAAEQDRLRVVEQEAIMEAGEARERDRNRKSMEQGRSRSGSWNRQQGGNGGQGRGGGVRRGGRGGCAGGRRGSRGGGGTGGGDSQPSESSGHDDRDYSTAEEEREVERSEARSRRRREREEGVAAVVPVNILERLMPVAVIEGVSPRRLLMLLTSFLLVCNVDTSKIILDYRSAYNKKKRFVQNFGGEALDKFAEEVRVEGYKTGIHFDSKFFTHDMDGKVEGAHRMVTTINSPLLQREQAICAARMEVETGRTVAEQLFVQMEGLDLTESVAYMVADTPSVNFGQDEGAIMNFQRLIQRPILAIPCPHHTEELPAKAVAQVISGRPSTGPKDPLLQIWNTFSPLFLLLFSAFSLQLRQ